MTTATRERPSHPDDAMRLFVERADAGDAEGMAALFEEDAVPAYPRGGEIRGREAILATCRALAARRGGRLGRPARAVGRAATATPWLR